MKPPPFEYEAPSTVEEVVALLQQHDGEAKIIAGGQSLMPLLNMRFARPSALIDLGRLTDLDYIREENGALAIGAMTTKRSIERSELVKSRQPLLHASTTWIAHPQIRNRGTVGGSMAQADPAAEYPAVALALDAEFVIVGPDGRRSVAASDFFVTYLTTALEENEVLTEIRVPVLPERTGWSIQELARRHGDFAMVGAVATLGIKCSRGALRRRLDTAARDRGRAGVDRAVDERSTLRIGRREGRRRPRRHHLGRARHGGIPPPPRPGPHATRTR